MQALSALNVSTRRPQRLEHRLQCGRHEQQGQVAVDDRRHAREQLQRRLEDGADAPRGVLAQVDGAQQADRQGDERRADGDDERPPEQRQEAEPRRACRRGRASCRGRSRAAETPGLAKNRAASTPSTTTMPTVVSTVTAAQAKRKTATTGSWSVARREWPGPAGAGVGFGIGERRGHGRVSEGSRDRLGIRLGSRPPVGGERLLVRRPVLLGRRHVAGLLRQLLDVVEVVLHERRHRRPLQRRLLHVDVQRPGERRVRLLEDRLQVRLDGRRVVLRLDRDGPERRLVRRVVGVAEVAEAVGVARRRP